MRLIWATRGRSWGFRFLLDGGFDDPLPMYEKAFARTSSSSHAWARAGERVSVRFPDPLGRCDEAGRVIPHEFVIVWPRPWTDGIDSAQSAQELVWPLVAKEFTRIWDLAEPPVRPHHRT